MPISATERFARTYTPRIPDDSYDSLGGAGGLPDSIIHAPFQKPFEEMIVRSSFSNGLVAQTLVPTGQKTRINLANSFAGGSIQTSGIGAPVQPDNFQLTTAMAGGTLH